MKAATYFLIGLLFGAGLILGGMTQPTKVVGFLDFFGDWDPSLAFVMGGAILVHVLAYRIAGRRVRPLWAGAFQIPTRKDIDARLVLGSVVFGVGWGMAGYCPGPGLTSLSTLHAEPFVFVGAMAAGMLLYGLLDRKLQGARAPSPKPPLTKAETT